MKTPTWVSGVPCELGARVRSWFRKLKPLWVVDQETLNVQIRAANRLASSYVPSNPSQENKARAEQAIQKFQEVLIVDPENLTAIDGIGSLFLQMGSASPIDTKALEESRKFHSRHIQINPSDPQPYYWIGVINWTIAFRAFNEARSKCNNGDTLPPAVRSEFAAKYGALIEEGISHLQKTISLSPGYYGAMAYLSLLYRRKADITETVPERETLTQLADGLREQAREIRQRDLDTSNLPPNTRKKEEEPWLH